MPREDLLLPKAHKNDPKPPLPAPPPTPPVRMTRSKKSSLKTAPSNENPEAPRADGMGHKSQDRKASTISEKTNPARSQIHVVVESSDSEVTTSDQDGAESRLAPKASSNVHFNSRRVKKPLPKAVKPSEPVAVKPLAQCSHSTAPPASEPPAWCSASSEPTANRPPALRSTSTKPIANKLPSRRSTSVEPSQPGSSLKVNVDDFIPLTADVLTKYAGLSSTHGTNSSSTVLTGSKRLGGVTGARPPSPPKKAHLVPISEAAALPSAAVVSVSPVPAAVAITHALPALPSAPIASAALVTAVAPSAPTASATPAPAVATPAVTMAHALPAPPSAPVPSAAAVSREQAFYVPPGMMLDPAYFGGGGFMRFGGDSSSMEGRGLPSGFGFQGNAGHFPPMHGAFIPPQSMGGFSAFGGPVQSQGDLAFFFPGNYSAHPHIQASMPVDLPAVPGANFAGAQAMGEELEPCK